MACLLGDPRVTRRTVSHALKAYEAVRLPFANARIEGSRENGMMYEFNSGHEDRLDTLGPAIEAQWNWLWETTLEEEVLQATAVLGSRIHAIPKRLSRM